VGVWIAAAMNAMRNTYRRCFASHDRWTTPTRTSAQMTTGTSATRPMPSTNVVTNDRYSSARS